MTKPRIAFISLTAIGLWGPGVLSADRRAYLTGPEEEIASKPTGIFDGTQKNAPIETVKAVPIAPQQQDNSNLTVKKDNETPSVPHLSKHQVASDSGSDSKIIKKVAEAGAVAVFCAGVGAGIAFGLMVGGGAGVGIGFGGFVAGCLLFILLAACAEQLM